MNVIKKIFAILMIIYGALIFLCGGFGILFTNSLLTMVVQGLGVILLSFLLIYAGYRLFKGHSIKIPKVDSSSPDLTSTLSTIDISQIASVSFFPKNGTGFTIKTPNIKRLAVYITTKLGKTTFEAEELRKPFDYVVKHIQSDLSKTDFNLVQGKIEEFVKSGGEVKVNRI